jgi:hypothetical protein
MRRVRASVTTDGVEGEQALNSAPVEDRNRLACRFRVDLWSRIVSDFDRDREIARLLGFPARVEQFAPGFAAH